MYVHTYGHERRLFSQMKAGCLLPLSSLPVLSSFLAGSFFPSSSSSSMMNLKGVNSRLYFPSYHVYNETKDLGPKDPRIFSRAQTHTVILYLLEIKKSLSHLVSLATSAFSSNVRPFPLFLAFLPATRPEMRRRKKREEKLRKLVLLLSVVRRFL